FLLRLDREGDHPAEVMHLPRGNRVARVSRQARVEHLLDARMPFEEARDRVRVMAVLPHPDGQRLDTAQDEPAVEWTGDRAERLLQEREPLSDRRIVRGREAADDVGMAAEVLRRRVDDDVRSQLERALEKG